MKIWDCDHASSDQDNGCNQNLNQRKAISFFYNPTTVPHSLSLTGRTFDNQEGYSLIEVLIAAAIAVICMVSIWYILLLVQSQFSSLQNKIRSEIELNDLMFTVEHYTGMAANLSLSNTSLPPSISFNSSLGKIAAYSMTNPSTLWSNSSGPKIDTLAYFLRDSLPSYTSGATPPLPSMQNRFVPTALFFQRPTPDTFGVLYVNFPKSINAIQISPSPSDYFFEGLVDLKIEVTASPSELSPGQNMVFSVIFLVTQRHFAPTVTNLPLKWCPPTEMNINPKCLGSRPYKDLTKTFTIKIRNNVIGESVTQRKLGAQLAGAAGPYPPVENRVFGNIYFLRPSYPTGALKR